MRSAEFVDVAKFPEITFKSRRVKQTSPHQADVSEDLTMHGVTRPITLNVQLIGGSESAAKNQTTCWRVTTGTAQTQRLQIGLEQGR